MFSFSEEISLTSARVPMVKDLSATEEFGPVWKDMISL